MSNLVLALLLILTKANRTKNVCDDDNVQVISILNWRLCKRRCCRIFTISSIFHLLFFSFFISIAVAQDGALDLSFNPGSGANGTVFTISVQSDERIIAGGTFNMFNGVQAGGVVRLHSDGTVDTSFNTGTGFNGTVFTTNIQSDGKIIIGGTFTMFNGILVNRIARLHANGSIDTSFNTGTGFNNFLLTSAIQNDGKILVGGNFTVFNGDTINRFARLHSNGSLDTNFSIYSGANNVVADIEIQSNGQILVGGYFTYFSNGYQMSHLVRFDSIGNLDTFFGQSTGLNNVVLAAKIESNGQIIAAGSFTSFFGNSPNLAMHVVRLSSTGNWIPFASPGSGTNDRIEALAVQSDGKIIVGGTFTTCNSISRNRISRMNYDGSLDTTFDPGSGTDNTVHALNIQSDSKILIGGAFSTYNGISRNGIARILAVNATTIPEVHSFPVVIYPNPTTGSFLIITGENNVASQISVYNQIGEKVSFRAVNFSQGIHIDIHGDSGIYFVEIKNSNEIRRIKFIKL